MEEGLSGELHRLLTDYILTEARVCLLGSCAKLPDISVGGYGNGRGILQG